MLKNTTAVPVAIFVNHGNIWDCNATYWFLRNANWQRAKMGHTIVNIKTHMRIECNADQPVTHPLISSVMTCSGIWICYEIHPYTAIPFRMESNCDLFYCSMKCSHHGDIYDRGEPIWPAVVVYLLELALWSIYQYYYGHLYASLLSCMLDSTIYQI